MPHAFVQQLLNEHLPVPFPKNIAPKLQRDCKSTIGDQQLITVAWSTFLNVSLSKFLIDKEDDGGPHGVPAEVSGRLCLRHLPGTCQQLCPRSPADEAAGLWGLFISPLTVCWPPTNTQCLLNSLRDILVWGGCFFIFPHGFLKGLGAGE